MNFEFCERISYSTTKAISILLIWKIRSLNFENRREHISFEFHV